MLLALTMVSCGGESQKAEDIKVKDLKDACGCVDAVGIVADDVLAYADEKGGKVDDMSDEDKKTMKDKVGKIDEIMKHCRGELELKKSDFEGFDNFDNFDDVDKSMEKLQDL